MSDYRVDWHCERCGRDGRVIVPDHADVWTVAQAILDAHTAQRGACLGGRNDIRCWLPSREARDA